MANVDVLDSGPFIYPTILIFAIGYALAKKLGSPTTCRSCGIWGLEPFEVAMLLHDALRLQRAALATVGVCYRGTLC